MKYGYFALVRLLLLAFLFFPSIGASGQPAGPSQKPEVMSIWRARRTLTAAADFNPDRFLSKAFLVNGANFRFTPDTLEFDEISAKYGTRHSKLDLKTLDPLTAKCEPYEAHFFPCTVPTAG